MRHNGISDSYGKPYVRQPNGSLRKAANASPALVLGVGETRIVV